ncbi:hypothetical protein ScPMuIL_010131 [Solemya velum]
MCKLHTLTDLDHEQESGLFPKLQQFLHLCPEKFNDPELHSRFLAGVKPKSVLLEELGTLKNHIENLHCPVVFSHNDLLPKNIILDDRKETVSFIDLEYAMYNYQPYDIANHFNSYAGVAVDNDLYPDHEYQLLWIRNYLEIWNEQTACEAPLTDLAVERFYVQVKKFALVARLFWGLWALIQANNSTVDFDYLGYGIDRLNEYFARKDELLALKVP